MAVNVMHSGVGTELPLPLDTAVGVLGAGLVVLAIVAYDFYRWTRHSGVSDSWR